MALAAPVHRPGPTRTMLSPGRLGGATAAHVFRSDPETERTDDVSKSTGHFTCQQQAVPPRWQTCREDAIRAMLTFLMLVLMLIPTLAAG